MIKPLVTWLLLAAAAAPCAAQEEHVLRVGLNALTEVNVAAEIGTILVANPTVADVAPIDRQRVVVIGRTPGATGLLVLSKAGERLIETTVFVAADAAWTVRVNRGASQTTLTCSPNCVPTVESPTQTGSAPATTPLPK